MLDKPLGSEPDLVWEKRLVDAVRMVARGGGAAVGGSIAFDAEEVAGGIFWMEDGKATRAEAFLDLAAYRAGDPGRAAWAWLRTVLAFRVQKHWRTSRRAAAYASSILIVSM